MTEPEPIGLDDAYALESPEDSRRLYARWADTYDSGFVQPLDYRYPERVAAVFVDVAGELDGPILDVGCGTGLVGLALAGAANGDVHIDGIDISNAMIDRAARRRARRRQPRLPSAHRSGPHPADRHPRRRVCRPRQRRHVHPWASRTGRPRRPAAAGTARRRVRHRHQRRALPGARVCGAARRR